jgi:Cu+-exporting ATPase
VNERASLKQRFWIALALSVALAVLAVARDYVGGHVFSGVWIARMRWVELALATLAVFWCGRPLLGQLLARAADGPAFAAVFAAAIYVYGLLGLLVPELWPRAWRDAHGTVPMRFELASGVIALALLFELVRRRYRARAAR